MRKFSRSQGLSICHSACWWLLCSNQLGAHRSSFLPAHRALSASSRTGPATALRTHRPAERLAARGSPRAHCDFLREQPLSSPLAVPFQRLAAEVSHPYHGHPISSLETSPCPTETLAVPLRGQAHASRLLHRLFSVSRTPAPSDFTLLIPAYPQDLRSNATCPERLLGSFPSPCRSVPLFGPSMDPHSLRAGGHSTHHCPVKSWSLVCPRHRSLPSPDSWRSITLIELVKEGTSERASWPLWRPRPTYSLICGAQRTRTRGYLQFSPGVELLQAVHGLLPVHAGGHGGPVLEEVGERSVSAGRPSRGPPTPRISCGCGGYLVKNNSLF